MAKHLKGEIMAKTISKKASTKKKAAKKATKKTTLIEKKEYPRATTDMGRNPICLTLGQTEKIINLLSKFDRALPFLEKKLIKATA